MGSQANFDLAAEIDLHPATLEGLKAERTFVVEGFATNVDAEQACRAGGCYVTAMRLTRMAMEQGCGTIEVKQGHYHRHRFSVVDILRHSKRKTGRLLTPRLRGRPRFLGTFQHLNQAQDFGASRPAISVPRQVCGETSPRASGGRGEPHGGT